MLQALLDRDIVPDLLVGTSAGGINAAFVGTHGATHEVLKRLAAIWRGIRRADIFPVRLRGAISTLLGRDYVASPAGLFRLLEREIGRRLLEDAAVPVHLIATDVLSGEEVRLSRGDVLEAVLASAAIPGLFPPVPWGGRLLMDGAISNNAPLSHSLELVDGPVYVLPTGTACALRQPPRGALALTLHAVSLLVMRRLLVELESLPTSGNVIVIPPPCPLAVAPSDFTQADLLVSRARRDTLEFLDGLTEGRHTAVPALSMHSHY